MSLRRRLVVTIVAVAAAGLVAVDLIALSSLHSFLYGRVDSQLTTTAHQVAAVVRHGEFDDRPLTAAAVRGRVSPDVYVLVLGPNGSPVVTVPSGSRLQADPPPRLPHPLPVQPLSAGTDGDPPSQAYRPAASAVTVGSTGSPGPNRGGAPGPEYRLLAVAVPGRTLVVATRLDSVTATLDSLRAVLVGLTLGLLALLVVVITVVVRRGLRPLEDMSREADAIAAGDLTRRVHPSDGSTEISRLGRALNGMLAQIETAFAQRAGSEERLRRFLADASHELRTPLTSIQGYAELLRKDALSDDEAQDRALERIGQEAARMGVLVGDLAVLAREGEGPAPEMTRVDLTALVAAVVDDARVIGPDRPFELYRPRPVAVLGDPVRLEQLVHNLVDNALAHTPPGTPVEVRVTAEGERALLEVQDHGPGLDAEQAARVFDRFYRGTAVTRDGGSGLGLFIVARLARAFGGTASVASEPGAGATFTVELPLAPPEPAGPDLPTDGARAGAAPAADGPGDGAPALPGPGAGRG